MTFIDQLLYVIGLHALTNWKLQDEKNSADCRREGLGRDESVVREKRNVPRVAPSPSRLTATFCEFLRSLGINI